MTDLASPAAGGPPPGVAAAPTSASASAPPAHWQPPARRRLTTLVIVLAAIAGSAAFLAAWQAPPFAGTAEVTDDAYIRGLTVVIAPQVSGYVVSVEVTDYQRVGADTVLVRIDDSIYRQRVAQAQATLDSQIAALANNRQARAAAEARLQSEIAGLANAKAQLQRAQADLRRVDDLVRDGSVSIRERDQTVAAFKQAEAQQLQAEAGGDIAREEIRTVDVAKAGLEAQVEAARAALQLAQIDLSHCVITAPEAGQLSEIAVRLGQYVTNGTELLSLVPADRWVIANYKEAQTAHMALGQKASVTVDGLGGAKFTGSVERIAPAAESEFAILKADNATGNFVKVPQRIGVRIALDPGQAQFDRLLPGMSVEARIESRDAAR
jgi:multidrug resistance efflux pump